MNININNFTAIGFKLVNKDSNYVTLAKDNYIIKFDLNNIKRSTVTDGNITVKMTYLTEKKVNILTNMFTSSKDPMELIKFTNDDFSKRMTSRQAWI